MAALEDPLLQKFFHLRGSYVVLKRLDNWLVSFFEDQLQVPHHSQNTILSMLRSIRGYTQSTKVSSTRNISPSQLMGSETSPRLLEIHSAYAGYMEWRYRP